MSTIAEQDVAFWGAVAQMVPVTALALVLEARLLAQRMGKKRSSTMRKFRFVWIAWLFLTWVLLFSALMSALNILAAGTLWPSDQEKYGTTNKNLAIIAILNAVLMVAYTPVARVINASAALKGNVDPFAYPWSRGSRLIRSMTARIPRLESAQRQAQAARLDALGSASEFLVYEGEAGRAVKFSESLLGSDSPRPLTAAERAALRRDIAAIEAFRQSLLENYETAMLTVEELSQNEAEFLNLERAALAEIAQLQKLKRTSAKHSDAYVRRAFARSTQ